MRRILSIAALLLVFAQGLAASVPMLHQPPQPKPAQAHGGHDCCPKPVMEVRKCCPTTISCPHQQHSAGACCCAGTDQSAVPSRKMIGSSAAVLAPMAVAYHAETRQGWTLAGSIGPPLDNSPPILVLRN